MPDDAGRPNILFLCTANSCRSQMAEGWARELHPSRLNAYSAGTRATTLNPLAVRAMAEAGVDISSHMSKTIDDLRGIEFDAVVTVCDSAHEACPIFPGATRILHRSFEDPPRLAAAAASDEEAMPHYRQIRDEIRGFVRDLPERIARAETAPRNP